MKFALIVVMSSVFSLCLSCSSDSSDKKDAAAVTVSLLSSEEMRTNNDSYRVIDEAIVNVNQESRILSVTIPMGLLSDSDISEAGDCIEILSLSEPSLTSGYVSIGKKKIVDGGAQFEIFLGSTVSNVLMVAAQTKQ